MIYLTLQKEYHNPIKTIMVQEKKNICKIHKLEKLRISS